MPQYEILACPDCNGKGCPTCQNTGKVRVTTDQLQKLKNLTNQIPSPNPLVANATKSSQQFNQLSPANAGQTNKVKTNTNLAGIIAFSILSIIAGAGFSSWYFLKTLKPFFAGLITLLTLAGTRFAWTKNFFKLQQPDDFLAHINQKK